MALWTAAIPTWTPIAVADTAAMTDNGHHTIQGGSTTQLGVLRHVYLGGHAATNAPTLMVLGRTSTVGGTLTPLRLAPTHPNTAVLAAPPVSYAVSTTKPQRSATLGMLVPLTFNAFGGIVNWWPNADEVVAYLGNTQPLGELSLNAFTGGTPGLLTSRILFEVA